jgi:hypothetical protein
MGCPRAAHAGVNPDLAACLPKDRHDQAAVQRAADLGFPALNPILPQLLAWGQDINWPVTRPIFALLAQAGPEIVPHLQAIFRSDDAIWSYWIVADLTPRLASPIWDLIAADIHRMATNPTAAERKEEVDLVAAEALQKATARNG